MGHFPLLNCLILLGQYDISGDMNSVVLNRSQADLVNDTFGPSKTTRARIPGEMDGVFGLAGLVNLVDDVTFAASPSTVGTSQDNIFFTNMSLSDIPIMLSQKGAVDFERTKFGLIQQGQYKSGGTVGQRAEFSAEGKISNYVLTDGNIMAVGAKTATFNGTARQLGAISASQKLYAQIHATLKSVFTSAVFKVQSASDQAFTSPNDRITFSTITDLTSQFATPVSGAITDTWWRVVCSSFTGTSLTVYVTVGIQ